MCHGFAGVKELLLPEFADAFARAGFTVLTFDYRGFGESGGEKGRLVPRLQVEDAIAALDFATTLPSVDETKIALWGTSLGGAIAIVTASEDERVRALSVQLTFGSGKRVVTGGMSKEDKEKFLSTLDRMEKKRTSTGKEMFVPLKKVLTDPQSAAFYERYVGDFEALKIKIPFLTVVETMALCPE
jgi:cephalosporin-C deacetylase-like acetyl esterase